MSMEEDFSRVNATEAAIEEELSDARDKLLELAKAITSVMEYVNREEGEIVEITNGIKEARDDGLTDKEKEYLQNLVERVDSEIKMTDQRLNTLKEDFECEEILSALDTSEKKLNEQLDKVQRLEKIIN